MMLRYLLFFSFFACYTTVNGDLVDAMTLEEKVGQIFMAYFDGENANDSAERLIRETKIGSIIYYNWANKLKDPLTIQQLSSDLQSLAKKHVKIPLFIAIDQEGGKVTRLREGFTQFLGNGALGETNRPELAYNASYCMGREMKAVGINFNLAPVVDVNSNPQNPIIGTRSFGNDKEKVAEFGEASVQGFLDADIIPCLKHFPGHGDVTVDPHKKLPVVNKSYKEIDDLELYPFKQLVDKVPAIMTAHILFPQIDPHNAATLSPHILQTILRENLHFKGVLITDSLLMQGLLEDLKNLEEVLLKAFEAGNDILLLGGRDLQHQVDGETHIDEIIRLYQCMINAVKSGRISEERVNESVTRILNLKKLANVNYG